MNAMLNLADGQNGDSLIRLKVNYQNYHSLQVFVFNLLGLYKDLITGDLVHEWAHQLTSGEVENQPKGDGDGQCWEGTTEYGQKE